MGKVIHVSDELHARIRAHCRGKVIDVKKWAEAVLEIELNKYHHIPTTKKEMPILGTGEDLGERTDVWQQPPFWKRTYASHEKDQLEKSGAVSPTKGNDLGGGVVPSTG
jgi:hypothetical protein